MTRHSDYWDAAFWATLGFIIVSASWRIERLENLSINPWSAPGLTPGVVGALMILAGVVLAWQARRQAAVAAAAGQGIGGTLSSPQTPELCAATTPPAGGGHPDGWCRTMLAGAMCVLFAGPSLGRGLPFVLEAALFIFAFITVFSWTRWRAEGRLKRGLATALGVAAAAATVISGLFESVFLVRLP